MTESEEDYLRSLGVIAADLFALIDKWGIEKAEKAWDMAYQHAQHREQRKRYEQPFPKPEGLT